VDTKLSVAEVRRETPDSCSVVLVPPPGNDSRFSYRPGQFLTVQVPHPDGPVARCYSLCSSPAVDKQMRISVKRMQGGLASNWINDHLQAGDTLSALPPSGTFTPKSFEEDFLLFAGGSGITPVLSILKTALALGRGRIQLFYMNRDCTSVMFASELARLEVKHADRFRATQWLESELGIPSRAQLSELAAPFVTYDAFVCGPSPFMEAVTHALRELGVPPLRVHVERFQSLEEDPFSLIASSGVSDASAETVALDVQFDGEVHRLRWPTNVVLLETLENNGIEAPYSCRQGLCSACACVLVRGNVRMIHNAILEREDLDAGLILACQSLPTSDEIEVRYE
jgi:3-ketosteroid 9alpha-monooxygenase subunit B